MDYEVFINSSGQDRIRDCGLPTRTMDAIARRIEVDLRVPRLPANKEKIGPPVPCYVYYFTVWCETTGIHRVSVWFQDLHKLHQRRVIDLDIRQLEV